MFLRGERERGREEGFNYTWIEMLLVCQWLNEQDFDAIFDELFDSIWIPITFNPAFWVFSNLV